MSKLRDLYNDTFDGTVEFYQALFAWMDEVTTEVDALNAAANLPPPANTKILFAPEAGSWLDPVMNSTDPAWLAYVQKYYRRIIKLWG